MFSAVFISLSCLHNVLFFIRLLFVRRYSHNAIFSLTSEIDFLTSYLPAFLMFSSFGLLMCIHISAYRNSLVCSCIPAILPADNAVRGTAHHEIFSYQGTIQNIGMTRGDV